MMVGKTVKKIIPAFNEWSVGSFMAGEFSDICNMLFEMAKLAQQSRGDVTHPKVRAWLRKKNREHNVEYYRLTFIEDYTRVKDWVPKLGGPEEQRDLLPLIFWLNKLEGEFYKLSPENPIRKRRKVSNGLRYKILKRDSFCCILCGASGRDDELQVDHIIPIAKGGNNSEENLRTLCRRCNSGKYDRIE